MRLLATVFFFLSLHSIAHAWGDDPTPSRQYTREDLGVLMQQGLAAFRNNDGFFVDSGYVFYVTSGKAPQYVKDSSKVRSVLMYKGKLVALRSSGSVYILTEDKQLGDGTWYEIGNSTLKVATDGIDLYALTKRTTWMGLGSVERGVWVYRGTPGDLVWSFMPILMPYSCGNSTCFNTIIVPYVAGREIAFEDRGVPGAVNLIMVDGKVTAVNEAGQRVTLSKY